MIDGEKSKMDLRCQRFFFLFKDSLITESITLWNGSEDYCPLHFLSDGRRLVQMTGSGRGSRKAGGHRQSGQFIS